MKKKLGPPSIAIVKASRRNERRLFPSLRLSLSCCSMLGLGLSCFYW